MEKHAYKKEDKKKEIEATLFASGKRMSLKEIARLCRLKPEETEDLLKELEEEYEKKDSSLMFFEEGDAWKLTIKDKFLDVVRKIGVETELPKSIIETLAVVAWRAPVKQSDVIAIRTNKAYDHLDELEKLGYITRQKFSRTKLIKLSEKFFEYFDLPEKNIKDTFKNQESLAKLIEIKEKEIEEMKKEHEKRLKKVEEEKEPAKIKIVDEEPKIKVYGTKKEEKPEIKVAPKQTFEGFEVIDESKNQEKTAKQESNASDKTKESEELKKSNHTPPDNAVDKRVEEILNPKQESKKEDKEKIEETTLVGKGRKVKEPEEQEPRDIIESSRTK